MTNIADRIGGRVKQLIAEIINDGRLAEEGAQEIRKAETARRRRSRSAIWTS
ncbi:MULTISPECIES: hypothetical protein [Bradyrhizobium]|jgi:hypothetical protein|uniref:hypothetical protein n=1 Tax=Bradyrhizobium TaxID=374 RepID=UPI0014497FA2|nr:hypothetical protein BE61_25300 [Bradyrhizobium elkanii USDA 61]